MPKTLEELDIMGIATRVFNNASKEKKVEEMVNGVMSEVVYNDDELLRAYCRKVFPKTSGQIPDPSALWKFNTIMVELADNLIVKPNIDQFLGFIAETEQLDANTSLKQIKIETDYNINFTLVAHDSGVRTVKLGDSKTISQLPFTIGFGLTYDPLTKTDDEVNWYRKTIKEIGRAKSAYIYRKIFELIKAAGTLPAANVKEGTGLTFNDIKKVARTIQRRTGSKAVLLADELLLDYIASKMISDTAGGGLQPLLYDGLRAELFANMAPTNFGTFTGVPMENHFTDENNTKYQYKENEGIMVGSSDQHKAVKVSLIGGMTQKTDTELKDDRVTMWVQQSLAITLVYPNRVGYIREDSIAD